MMRLKRTTKKTVAVVLISMLILIAVFLIFYVISMKQNKVKYETEIGTLKTTLMEYTKQIYVSTRDIKYGEVISVSDVSEREEIVSLEVEKFFTSADIGTVALVNIPQGSVITKSMITKEKQNDTIRETQFDVLVLNSNLTNGDFVDVRIRYQNGEDYIVLAKKRVKNISLHHNICYMDLMEEEMLFMSSAIVDAGVYGAILYTTTYIEPELQKSSMVTYQPSQYILKIMQENPNIVELSTNHLSVTARKIMEERVKEYETTLLYGGNGTDSSFNITEVPEIDTVGNKQKEDFVEYEDVEE